LTHTFLVLVTVGLGHGVYRKLDTLIGGQSAEKFENHWCNPNGCNGKKFAQEKRKKSRFSAAMAHELNFSALITSPEWRITSTSKSFKTFNKYLLKFSKNANFHSHWKITWRDCNEKLERGQTRSQFCSFGGV